MELFGIEKNEQNNKVIPSNRVSKDNLIIDFNLDESKLKFDLNYYINWKLVKNNYPNAFEQILKFSESYKPRDNMYFPLEIPVNIKIDEEFYQIYQSPNIIQDFMKPFGIIYYCNKGDSETYRYVIKAVNPYNERETWVLYSSKNDKANKAKYYAKSVCEIKASEKAFHFLERILTKDIQWNINFVPTQGPLSNFSNEISYFEDNFIK